MVIILSYILQAIFCLVVLSFSIYVLLELRVMLISRKVERRKLAQLAAVPAKAAITEFPKVSVLLPIYNEAAVVTRLIDAAAKLIYEPDRMEILVLDDSTDSTSSLADARVALHAADGINIRCVRRTKRTGYKAGNLIHGIGLSDGEFFAIFDADFMPPEDFLLRAIPHFADPKLGFLQTGIGYENRDASFLTKFQAMEMGHQQYVTVGLSEDGDMASLSGSSCVWRKACIEAVGGWSAGTVTEDVDLGYRAQISDWKYAYLRDVVSMSVLPETISAFRIQRERWGRGLIHSAFKHTSSMLHQPMPLMKRMHAIAMMFSSLLLASIYVLILLSLPLNYLVNFEETGFRWGAVAFFVLAVLWAVDNTIGARKGAWAHDPPPFWHMLWNSYLYIAMFLPMAWYYFFGGMRAALGVYGEFHRTPKGKEENDGRAPRINSVMLAGEVFTFLYSALAAAAALQEDNYFLIPLNVTVCVGFGMVIYWSFSERARTASESTTELDKINVMGDQP